MGREPTRIITVLVEITGLVQCARFQPKLIELERGRLLSIFSPHCKKDYIKANCLCFSLSYTEESAPNIGNSIQSVYYYLQTRLDEYQSFFVLVNSYKNLSVASVFTEIMDSRLPILRVNSVFVSPSVVELFDGETLLEEAGVYRVVVQPDRNFSGLYALHAPIRWSLINCIQERIIPEVGTPIGSGFHFYGPWGVGVEDSVIRALKKLAVPTNSPPLLVFSGRYSGAGIPCELLDSLNKEFIEIVPNFLLPLEREVWDSRSNLLSTPPSGRGGWEDARSLVQLYVLAYKRACVKALIPPYVLLRQLSKMSSATVQTVVDLLNGNEEPGLVPILITEDSSTPKILKGSIDNRMSVGRLSVKETSSYLKEIGVKCSAPGSVKKITQGTIPLLVHYSALSLLGEVQPDALDGKELTRELVALLGRAHRRLLYSISIYPGLIGWDGWIGLMEKSGVLPAETERVLTELSTLKLIEVVDQLEPVFEEMGEWCMLSEGDMSSLRSELSDLWDALSMEEHRRFGIIEIERIVRTIKTGDEFTDSLLLYYLELSERLIDEGFTSEIEAAVTELSDATSARKTTLKEAVVKILLLRLAIAGDSPGVARIRYHSLELDNSQPITLSGALIQLCIGRYYHWKGENRAALERVKLALYYIRQSGASISIEREASSLIGMILIALRRIDEGLVYLYRHRDMGGIEQNAYSYGRNIANIVICHYLMGNYSKALKVVEESEGEIRRRGVHEWSLFLIFIRGRLQFDLGDYTAAERIFVDGLALCTLRSKLGGSAKPVFHRWLARCQIYSNAPKTALRILASLEQGCETCYFLSEAYYFAGRYDEALELLKRVDKDNEVKGDNYHPIDRPSWNTGYSDVEDRALTGLNGQGSLTRCVDVFKEYLECVLSSTPEKRESLLNTIRGARTYEEDPFNHFFYFLASHAAQLDEMSNSTTHTTLLSRALRYLQLRGRRIDDTDTRISYYKQNRWNSKLMEEARKWKLI